MGKMDGRYIMQKATMYPNFMTPRILEYGLIKDDVAYELSAGTGMDGQQIFGVTVAEHVEGTFRNNHDLGKLCFSSAEAREYIESLKAY